MNERIRELYQQAYDSVHEFQAGMLVLDPVEEKFAELIVRECVGVAVDNGCGDFVDIEHLLLKHFGVEL
jgi:hypothetical protein